MTACTNKARGAVVAALAGVLALGAVPAVALATGSDVSLQFVEPTGAFEGAKKIEATFNADDMTYDSTATPEAPATKTYDGKPVALNRARVTMIGGAHEQDRLVVNLWKVDEDFDVEYFTRNDDGEPETPVDDPTEVGEYVAVVTALQDPYDGSSVYIPFDIVAQSIDVDIVSADSLYYDATVHNGDFEFAFNGDPVTEGVDYDVYYILDGHDTGDEVDVKDAGTYRAVLVGKGAYAGTTVLSDNITIKPLNLNDYANVHFEGLAATGDDEIENILAIWINGHRFTGGDAIMGELRADIDTTESDSSYAGTVWKDNGKYRYNGYKADPNNGNILDGTRGFDAFKVKYLANFQYDGQAWPTSGWETVLTDADTVWNSNNVTAHAQNGLQGGVDLAYPGQIEKYRIFDASGEQVDGENMTTPDTSWSKTAGTYTLCYRVTPEEMADNGYVYGGQTSTVLTVYNEAIDADAEAAVIYNDKVVSSINAVYDTSYDLREDIRVVVMDADDRDLIRTGDAVVTYYDSEGREVKGDLTDAGTYTLKVTAKGYKLTGTTEMTVTIAPRDLTSTVVSSLVPHKWDNVGNVTEYLRWHKYVGYTIDGLDLEYLKPNGDADDDDDWIPLPMADVKVTILDASGEQIDRIDDEGVYTIHFEARNAKAANNYVIPGDITVTCIKDGWNPDKVNHLKFRDVEYTDYFVNAVDYVSGKQLMTGYKFTKLFGADDTMNRGQMAIVLYNMAKGNGMMDENELKYDQTEGYITGFEDVDGNEYYAKAIAWARLAGVVNGYDETHFGPEDAITREEFAAMIMNYEKKFGDYEQADASVLDEFSDAGSVSAWATNAMSWAVANGVVNGTAEGALIPTCDIIRADAACMVYNYVK